MDVIAQKAGLSTEGIMPRITSVKRGISFGSDRGEESEVSCSGVHRGTLKKEICEPLMHHTSSVNITHPGPDETLPGAPGGQSWHTSAEKVC